NNKVLASGFPGAGLQSFVAGSAENVQFMVKDSKKYAATDGWGFADFKNGKPGDEALDKTWFPCHQPAKGRDFVFARYAPTPRPAAPLLAERRPSPKLGSDRSKTDMRRAAGIRCPDANDPERTRAPLLASRFRPLVWLNLRGD